LHARRLSSSTAGDRTFLAESNVAAFVLAPLIESSPVSVRQEEKLTLKVRPEVGPEQRAQLLLGDHMVEAEKRTVATAELSFKIPAGLLPSGEERLTYPLLVRVDGATSLLADDPNPAGPGFQPALTVTRT
jgi:hypothetical protein